MSRKPRNLPSRYSYHITDDGLTQWHPAFLQLGNSLEECARKYKEFCQRYKPNKKEVRKCAWGQRLLEPVSSERPSRRGKAGVNDEKEKPTASKSNCRLSPSKRCQVRSDEELARIVSKFI